MANYRVYFIDQADHILAAADTIAATDGSAAIALCREHFNCASVELWEGTRKVYRHMRDGLARLPGGK